MKRKLLFLGVSALAVLTMASCGSKKSDTKSSTKVSTIGAMKNYKAGDQFKAADSLDITMMYSDQPTYPYNKDWLFWKQLKKDTNVTIKPTIVPASDYAQKRSLLISSGDAPTIIAKTYPGEEVPFVSSGTVLPISDYVKYMPNYQKKIKQWKLENEVESLRQSDGKYYVLPGLHEEVWPDYTLIIRTDIFKKNNIAIPSTWKQLQTALTELKEIYPDSIPFSDRYQGNNILKLVAATYGTKAGWALGNGVKFNSEDKKFEYVADTSKYKNVVSYLHGLVKAGLLDKESFSQKDEQATQKFVSGNSFVITGNSQEVINYQKSMDESLGVGNYSIAKIDVPSGPEGSIIADNRLENGIMLSSKIKDNKNFKAILQFIDWLWYSDAGQTYTKWGVEGTTYNKADNKYTLASNVNYLGLNPTGKKDLRMDYGFSVGNFAYGGTTELLHSMMTEDELTFQKSMAKMHKEAPVDPAAPIDADKQQQASLLSTPLTDYINQNTLKFITGERSMSEYNKFLSELKSKGSEKYLKIINDSYKEYNEKNK